MGNLVRKIEKFFNGLGRPKSVALGLCIGGVLSALTFLTSSVGPAILSFLLYFPFHGWLVISLFLVVFSIYERARFVGHGHSFLGAFYHRFFSPYGLFCMGWLFSLSIGWSAVADRA